jgi:hypothetical protein
MDSSAVYFGIRKRDSYQAFNIENTANQAR